MITDKESEKSLDFDPEKEIETVHGLFMRNLRLLRLTEELTTKELEDKIGLRNQKIHDFEKGRSKPSFDDLILIVDYFPITFNDLLEGKLSLDIPSRRD